VTGIDMKFHPIQVHTYSGYKADERPLKFEHEGKEHMIREITKQTCEEIVGNGLRNKFTIRSKEGNIFTLFREEIKDQWFLEE
jgi:hypothetical protein